MVRIIFYAEMAWLDVDRLMSLTSMKDVEQAYRKRGFSGDVKQLLRVARQDFHEHAMNAARAVDQAPDQLEPERVTCGDVEFQVMGVIHGLLGGDDRNYLNLVNQLSRAAPVVLFENGLQHFYRATRHTVIPDFVVLGAVGAVTVGLHVVFSLPLLVLDLVRECFKKNRSRDASEGFLFDARYHTMDPELRRGLDEFPPLPSVLEIEHALSVWDRSSILARIRDPFSLVPRSLFMAGFAYGFAETDTTRPVLLIVGDLHTMEIIQFLKDPPLNHPVFKKGRFFGELKGPARFCRFWLAKVSYLAVAGLAGSVVLVGGAVLVFWIVTRLF